MYTKNILAIVITLSTMQLAAQDETVLFAKPNKSTKTCLLTSSAGIITSAIAMFSLDQIFSFFETNHVPLFFGLSTSTKMGPLRISATTGESFSVPSHYIIAGCGLVLGTFAAWLTYRSQPEGKFGRAHDVLNEALTDEILNELITAEENLLANIDDAYIHYSYPRVAAYNEFINYHQKLTHAATLLKEATTDAKTPEFTALTHTCLHKIKQYMDIIKECIGFIRTSPDWLKQLKGHNTMLAREAQERAAIAAQQIALNGTMNNHHCHSHC